jgi:hypothetical protein
MYLLDMDHRYLGKDAPFVAFRKISYNFDWASTYLNRDMYYAGKTLCNVYGGVIFGMELSVSGVNITVSSGVAVINDVVREASSVTLGVKSNTSGYVLLTYTTGGYKYYCGNISDIPSNYGYIIIGSYSNSGGVTTVSEDSKQKSTPILKSSITGSTYVDLDAHETKILEIDHGSTGVFEIPGYVSVSLNNGNYYGAYPGYSYASDFISAVAQNEYITPTTFRIEVTNSTASASRALITWQRSGIIRVNHT